jgi:threonyl-tRNA synthetase
MPKRFGLAYAGSDNAEHTPAMIHRALLGSLERFVGILLEHTAGDLPLWLAPVQVRLLPVSDRHREAVAGVRDELVRSGVRADVDDRDETVGKRIRDAELQKIPRVVVWGDKETPDAMAVRERHGAQKTASLADLVRELATL